LIDSGYQQTMKQMPELKSKIKRRVACEEVAARRNAFNRKTPPIVVNDIQLEGFTRGQKLYINKFFKSGKRPLYFNDIKTGYFKLVSEPFFNNVYPSFDFDTTQRNFNFRLSRRPQNNFQVDFGGMIATRSISHIFLGINYYSFNRALIRYSANFFAGNFYKSALLRARIDIPLMGQFYVEPELIFNNWSFLQGDDIVQKVFNPTVLERIDRRYAVNLGIPVGNQYKLVFSGAYISNNDQYIDTPVLVSTDTLDALKVTGWRGSFSFSTNSLNRKQYASEGKAYTIAGDWFNLDEQLTPGNTSVRNGRIVTNRNWVQARVTLEQYFRKGVYSSGYYLDGVLSNQPTFSNYFGTIIYAPAFNPMQDSRTLLLQNFRAFNYVAGGWRNVVALRRNLDFRAEAYAFKPLAEIKDVNQEAVLSEDITKVYFAGMASFVMHSAIGPISLSVNYYDDRNRQWGVLLHAGFLLFNKTSMEH
jgi:NTE family protein